MIRTILGGLIGGASAVVALYAGASLPDAGPSVLGTYAVSEGILTVWEDGSARLDPIGEDDPRWDCHIHGDRVCGPDFPV